MVFTEWSPHIQKPPLRCKDGFFELTYLSNSPRSMLASLSGTPEAIHHPAKLSITADNPFCRGIMKYRQLAEGFWLFATEIEIKQGIRTQAAYAEQESDEYYFLAFSVFEYEFPIKDKFNNNVPLNSVCWTFYKPGTEVPTYFYKNTRGRFYNLAFRKKWAEKFLSMAGLWNNDNIQNLLKEGLGFFSWLDIVPGAHAIAQNIGAYLRDEDRGAFDIAELREMGQELALEFFKHISRESRTHGYDALTNADYSKMAHAEKMVLLHLSAPFVGVEKIAHEITISPTKLKAGFKIIFGFSILQYHKEKNMLLATQLLQRANDQIKVIASLIGYSSNSKFAAAFKKRFGYLPSEAKGSMSNVAIK